MSIKASDILRKSNESSIAEILASGDDAAIDAMLIDRAADVATWMQAELRLLAQLRAHGVDLSGPWQHSLDEWRHFLDRLRELENEYGVCLVVCPEPLTKGRPLEWTEEKVSELYDKYLAALAADADISLTTFARDINRNPGHVSRLFARYGFVVKNAG